MKYIIQTTSVSRHPRRFILRSGFITKFLSHALVINNYNSIDAFYLNNKYYEIIKITDQELFKAKLAGI